MGNALEYCPECYSGKEVDYKNSSIVLERNSYDNKKISKRPSNSAYNKSPQVFSTPAAVVVNKDKYNRGFHQTQPDSDQGSASQKRPKQIEPDPKTLIEAAKIVKDNEHREKIAKIERFKLKIKQEEFEEFINQVVEKNKVINFEFRDCNFEEIKKFKMKYSIVNSIFLNIISFFNCDISRDSVINIVNSLQNLSQIDLSDNKFTVKETQSICDELNYLDVISMFNSKSELSEINSSLLLF